MKDEIMFNNAHTIVISHIAASNSPWLSVTLSLPQLRFSSQRCEFGATTFGKDEVLPRANGPIVSSGTVTVTFFRTTFLYMFVLGASLTALVLPSNERPLLGFVSRHLNLLNMHTTLVNYIMYLNIWS